jgi:glycosyltransferase involved in cell wall biosynthesis
VFAAPAARIARVPVCVAGRRSLGDYKAHIGGARVVERIATWMTDLLIANAEAVADDVVRTEGVSRSKVRVVYNALSDIAFDLDRPAALDTRLPVVLCVANLMDYKGHRYLLDAVAELRRRGIECTLALAGDGPERPTLECQAARLSIDVRFLGPRTDIPALLARANLVALPSLTEGMSNAVMEAMAAGRPVVATDVGGTAELLTGRGILVPPADVEALAAGMEILLRDPGAARRLGEAARNWSRLALPLVSMVDHHMDIYSKLLEAGARHGRAETDRRFSAPARIEHP